MRTLRPWLILAVSILFGGGAWAGFRAWNRSFCELAERRIAEELAEENLHADIGRLTLDPFRGLVAHKLRLYGGPEHQFLLARVDELRIEVDVSRYLQKEQFIQSIILNDASLALPLDPLDPKTNSLKLNRFNARVVASGDRFEVRQASGDFYGIEVNLTGSVLRPSARPPKDRRQRPRHPSPLEFIKERRETLARFLHELHRLRFEGESHPVVVAHITGDLDHPSGFRARGTLAAGKIGYGVYSAEELRLEADYAQGELRIRNIRLRDRTGALQGEVHWKQNRSEVPFRLVSTADLPGLMRAIHPWPLLREVVLYPPAMVSISAEGKWRLRSRERPRDGEGATDGPAGGWPIEALGHIQTGRFNSRGVVFDGMQGDFYLNGEDFHLRDFRLDHRSGAMTGRAWRQDGEWKYHSRIRLNPMTLAPFLPGDRLARWIERFSFTDASGVEAEVRGGGKDRDWINWDHRADVHLTTCRFDDLALRRAGASLHLTGRRLEATDLRVARPDGTITAPSIVVDSESETVDVRGLTANVDPVPVVRVFSPPLAKRLAAYRFREPPGLWLTGVIGTGENDHCDYTVQVQGKGIAEWPLGPDLIPLTALAVGLRVRDEIVDVNLRSRVQPGTRFHAATFTGTPDFRLAGRFDLKPDDGDQTGWSLAINAPGITEYTFAGKTLPVRDATGTFVFRRNRLDVERVTATLFGGQVTGSATVDRLSTTKNFSAALQFDSISFAPLATLYSPGAETTGQLSGGLRLLGSARPEDTLRGSGSAVIKDGNIFAIPLLGPLSPLVAAVLPGTRAGYSRAREARADLRIQNGAVEVRDFEGLATAFVIKGGGKINYQTRAVDLEARVNTRGPTGILLFPVSKLLEYEALGTTANPGWRSKVLSLPAKLIPGGR